MRIDDLRDGAGCLFAFEVSSWLGRYGTLQVARTIPGVRIVREPRAWFSWWGDDTFLEFEVEGVTFVAWEAYGDSSEYWIGPEPVRPVPQTEIVRGAFVRTPRWLQWRWKIVLLLWLLVGAASISTQIWHRFYL